MNAQRWSRRLLASSAGVLAFSSLAHAAPEVEILPVSPVMILPFVILLTAIAVAPFVNRKWWDANYPAISISLGLVSVCYYVFALGNGRRMVATLEDYVSFIALIGSLFVVAGGIHIRVSGRATPAANVLLLAFGCLISNVVGTTGASMLLIRPFLRTNRGRLRAHHVVFFIFLVSNVGGALTPIGDPPLFLGYLKGIPFLWVAGHLWLPWLMTVAALLLVFYVIDRRDFHLLGEAKQEEIETKGEEPRFMGLANLGFLLAILVAVFIEHPSGVRELVMVGAAIGSYLTTKRTIHERNDFNFVPIKEVSILFLGIFATMVPALDWLSLNARTLGIQTPGAFYWATGLLSSLLDNAPTYLNFLTAAFGLFHLNPETPGHIEIVLTQHWQFVESISLSAVFFGACTYIGNGPNFMVKSIAEQSGVAMPSFFGYVVRYTLPLLIPVYAVVWLLFFHS